MPAYTKHWKCITLGALIGYFVLPRIVGTVAGATARKTASK